MKGGNYVKIAIVEPVGEHGGMNYYDFGLAEGLVNSGADVTIYTYGNGNTTVSQEIQFEVRRFFKKIWGSELKVLRAVRFVLCLLHSLFDARQRQVELVHYHFFHYTAMEWLCISLARVLSFKIVVTTHDVESFSGKSSQNATSRILDKADKIIAHNQVSRKELLSQTTVSKDKISVIPHGNYLKTIPMKPTPIEARKILNFVIGEPVLLFFGQIKEVKGLDVLLQSLPPVIAKFPTLKLLVAGKVWKDNFSKYDRIIQENNLKNYVDLHIKYIPDEDVATYYRVADFVVLPYRKIYQSGVLLMAMSYGIPTIVSDLEGMLEIVVDGVNGFVFKEGDVANLSDKLIHALDNNEQAKQISKTGLETMRESYDWYDIGKRTLDLYQHL
jgi:glycosyltransferase involved in cell wall biosynthesis